MVESTAKNSYKPELKVVIQEKNIFAAFQNEQGFFSTNKVLMNIVYTASTQSFLLENGSAGKISKR